ncbi:hypothetical protein [Scytonema sp. NUACC26]|uniref:hypothetical protein n=1 Tax=Scytonema sp. NUACC26 TaxID=3140176 RepID=UPI0034DC59E1
MTTIRRLGWAKYIFLAVLVSLFVFVIHFFFFLTDFKVDYNTNDNFSWGEEILISGQGTEKEKGTEAFRYGNYKAAIDYFRKYLHTQQRNDPEALIYLNNAIAADSKNKSIKIATIAILLELQTHSMFIL